MENMEEIEVSESVEEEVVNATEEEIIRGIPSAQESVSKEIVEKMLKSLGAKIAGAINILREGKEIYAERKMMGVYHKIGTYLKELNSANESDKDS